jgi:hypothetical protein
MSWRRVVVAAMAILLASCRAQGPAAQLSAGDPRQAEFRALIARLSSLWKPPANVSNPEVVVVRILLNPDGTLAAPPKVLTSGSSPAFIASRDSALRAINSGQPFTMLKPENYELWKDMEINFDPQQLAARPN